MNGYKLSYSRDRIRAGETDQLLTPFTIRGADKYGVMALHGATAPDNFCIGTRWQSSKIVSHIAHAGIPVVAGKMSGDAFANPNNQTDMTNALPLLAQAGCSTSKVHLLGISMGGLSAIQWAGNNISKVASIQGIIPATSIDRIYQTNAGGLRASVGTAWGVTYPTPLPAGADLSAEMAAILSAGIPVRLHYTSSDTFIDTTGLLSDAALMGATTVDLGGTDDHSEKTIGRFNALGAGDSSDYINWIKGLGA